MELTELVLHNYKNHRKLSIKLTDGVNGIVGDNGTGKSNIISAISFLYTGEVDTDTKKESISLGETEGWVKGSFKHNGKIGSLERHLTASKVVLKYDNETYTKASEVTALWNDLLQIDATIFNNVIIAKQGEIQKLFSDESAVREKIFQKIFLVPPAEKLRSLIWDNYIKTCNPERAAEDIKVLNTAQAKVAIDRNVLLENIEVETLKLAAPTLIKTVSERIQYLERCRRDLVKRPELEQAQLNLQATKEQLETAELLLKTQLATCNLASTRKTYEQQLTNKNTALRKHTLNTELTTLNKLALTDNEYLNIKLQISELQSQAQELQIVSIENSAKQRDLVGKITKFDRLTECAECPTCNQVLPDISAFVVELRQQEAALKVQTDANTKVATTVGRSLQALNTKLASADTTNNRIKYLNDELLNIGDVEYSEETCQELKKSIVAAEKAQQDYQTVQRKLQATNSALDLNSEKMSNLCVYDGDSSIDDEIALMNTVLNEDNTVKANISAMELNAAKLQHELTLYNQRIEMSERNSEYNARRKQYITKLTEAYDILHVSKFPRKLIERYMDQVQSALAGYLQHFDLPYTASITDGFKIVLKDDAERDLPSVSGGQEVMVGICLRLALHQMFSKSFPLWIIDEGTTHLSETKKPMYFNLINELRNQKIINQIIIIDHDERLGSVVDQTIQL